MTQLAEKKKPLIILTGPTAVGKTVDWSCKSNWRRDHLSRFDAGIPAHGYRFSEDHVGGDGWCETPSDRCPGARSGI